MIYKSRCTVIKIEERFHQHHVAGVGKEAVFIDESTGWWAVVSGNLAIPLGAEKPDAVSGQVATLILDLSSDQPALTLMPKC
jgi:hypothetical protein